MAKKKRAWNMSNPLYRYLNANKKRSNTNKKRRGRGGGGSMARKRGGFRRGGGIGSIGGGMLGNALKGFGAATVVDMTIGNNPLIEVGLGYLVGGVGGAAGAAAQNYLKFNSPVSVNSGGYA